MRDIYALSVDYDAQSAETQQFFQIVQNKLHFAISSRTAAELIAERARPDAPNMGLTSWKGAKVRRGDVTVAKNYLRQEEIEQLDRIVTMYLDFAEDQAQRRRLLYMRDWREKLDAFLKFNEREILTDAGRVSMEVAKQLALEAYESFNRRRLETDASRADAEDDAFEAEARQIEEKAVGRRPGKPGPKEGA